MISKCTHPGDDFALFRKEMKDVKKIPQNNIAQIKKRNNKQRVLQRESREGMDNSFYFSDHQWFPSFRVERDPLRYTSADIPRYKIERMYSGLYPPEIFLDMHGMRQREAKRELGAMIAYCLRESLYCACVQHGIGRGILKREVPLWLTKHPDVAVLQRAPLKFGGDGALLVLLSNIEKSG